MDVHTCTCCHPSSQCFLVGAFNLLTFKVIINMYDPITIFSIVWGVLSVGLFFVVCFLSGEGPLVYVVKLVWWW